MHILFVEDEAKIANFVRAGLKEQGFVVDYCDNGDEGYSRALDNEYDVIAKRRSCLTLWCREKMVCPSSKTCAEKDRMCR